MGALTGAVALITGASGGIGFNVAKILVEKYDCKVIGIARNEEKILSAIKTVKNGAENFSYQLFDVTDKVKWAEFADYLEEKFTRIYGL